jgi:hypothetical protein
MSYPDYQTPINPKSNAWVAMLLLALLAMLAAIFSPGCTAPQTDGIVQETEVFCRDYYQDYNIKPSREIMEATGKSIAPAYVETIYDDGTVDLICFPGAGLCKRICPSSIPESTINPYTTEQVLHTNLELGDIIWFPYYEAWF